MIRHELEHEGHRVVLELHDKPEDPMNRRDARGFLEGFPELAHTWPVVAFVTLPTLPHLPGLPPPAHRPRVWVPLKVSAALWRTDPRTAALLAATAVDQAQRLAGRAP